MDRKLGKAFFLELLFQIIINPLLYYAMYFVAINYFKLPKEGTLFIIILIFIYLFPAAVMGTYWRHTQAFDESNSVDKINYLKHFMIAIISYMVSLILYAVTIDRLIPSGNYILGIVLVSIAIVFEIVLIISTKPFVVILVSFIKSLKE